MLVRVLMEKCFPQMATSCSGIGRGRRVCVAICAHQAGQCVGTEGQALLGSLCLAQGAHQTFGLHSRQWHYEHCWYGFLGCPSVSNTLWSTSWTHTPVVVLGNWTCDQWSRGKVTFCILQYTETVPRNSL